MPADRVDGVAYAPGAINTILAANNASNPGFLTLVNNATNAIIRTIKLDGTGGYPDVGGNGVEATIFNSARGTFFVAIPSFNAARTGAGGAIELDATTGALLNTYDFTAMGLASVCSPTGLVQGADASMFIACSDGTAGHSVILDPTGTGSLTLVNGISGGDQTAYNPTTNTFYEAARFQVGGPVLGIVDASTLSLQLLAIGANDHSVAVDPVSGEVYVATGATNASPTAQPAASACSPRFPSLAPGRSWPPPSRSWACSPSAGAAPEPRARPVQRSRAHATKGARSAAARAQLAPASSSNSSASFFITVPPSSSASTIVTARR